MTLKTGKASSKNGHEAKDVIARLKAAAEKEQENDCLEGYACGACWAKQQASPK